MKEHLYTIMLYNHKSDYWAKLLNISTYNYLRKCAAIKKELQLMGHTNYGIEIRNIPAKSDRYYLCYTNICTIASAYDVKRNLYGEIIQIVNSKEVAFSEQVEEYIESLVDPEDSHFSQSQPDDYPVAYPSNIEIYVYEDEKLDFAPTKSYKWLMKKCTDSYNNLRDKTNMSLKQQDVLDWLKVNKNLYWSLQLYWNYYEIGKFQHLYFLMDQWSQLFQMGPIAKNALSKLSHYNDDDRDDWFEDHHYMYFTNSIFWGIFLKLVDFDNHIYKHTCNHYTVFVQGKEITNCISFSKEFQALHNRDSSR